MRPHPDHATIPAQPGWTAVIAREFGSSSHGDPNTTDWTIEFTGFELEQLPIVAWSTAGFPYGLFEAWGRIGLDSRAVVYIDAEYVTQEGFLVGIFHPDHRPAPEDLDAHALEMAEHFARATEIRELYELRYADNEAT